MMGAGRTLTITTDTGDRVMVVSGQKAGDLCRSAGRRPVYVVAGALGPGWMLDLDRLADLVAIAEIRGYRVNVRELGEVA